MARVTHAADAHAPCAWKDRLFAASQAHTVTGPLCQFQLISGHTTKRFGKIANFVLFSGMRPLWWGKGRGGGEFSDEMGQVELGAGKNIGAEGWPRTDTQ